MSAEKKPEPGTFPQSWYAGTADRAGRPDFQIHAYNDDFYILRQAAFTNYEKPFLYLIFGNDKAILFDTGAGKADVAGAVQGVIQTWLKKHKRTGIPLIVAHSHAHGDHVAGDAQFANRTGITLVGKDTAAVRAFFGIQHWPAEMVTYDLGNRTLDIFPIPGHEASSIAVYDRRTHILLTGDTFYPGRLYVRDGKAFTASIQRLVDFSATHNVSHFLGTHVEQSSTPFKDYVVGTVDQPNEHVLELTRADLLEMNNALRVMNGTVVRKAFANLTIWPNTR
ncbi:MAG: MBL fold metallo-hydrolase [Gemmatimonadaceae bacterium]